MADNNFKDSLKYPRKYSNQDQKTLNNTLESLLDIYQKSNSFENREFLCYLTAAIYLTYKQLYPQLSIYIPFRSKSDSSYIKNIQKEFSIFINKNEPKTEFDVFPIIKDISGIRIVLDNINFSLPSTNESSELFSDPEVKRLLSKSHDYFHFADEVDSYLQSSIHQDGKKFLELKSELLEKILDVTPDEFTEERRPNLSFSQLYEETKNKYNYFLETDSFPTIIPDFEKDELSALTTEFRSKINNKLQFTVLRKTLPVVFNNEIIKNALQTSFEFTKNIKKENGFQSLYYNLNTPFGPVEVQAQSNRAYFTSTKGSAYHSGMDGKDISIKDFFELVDENDEFELSHYLDILDSISADSLISPYQLPKFKSNQERRAFLSTPKGIAYLDSEKCREMLKHIKIKESMEILPQYLPREVYTDSKHPQVIDKEKLKEAINCGNVNTTIINTNDYLLSTALSLSPYMNVCSSGHTSFTTAGIHHKKIIGEFSEILRKKDSNTVLRDLLIRRLDNLLENTESIRNVKINASTNYLNEIVKTHDDMSIKLPKDISIKNITAYAEKLHTMLEKNSSSDLVK